MHCAIEPYSAAGVGRSAQLVTESTLIDRLPSQSLSAYPVSTLRPSLVAITNATQCMHINRTGNTEVQVWDEGSPCSLVLNPSSPSATGTSQAGLRFPRNLQAHSGPSGRRAPHPFLRDIRPRRPLRARQAWLCGLSWPWPPWLKGGWRNIGLACSASFWRGRQLVKAAAYWIRVCDGAARFVISDSRAAAVANGARTRRRGDKSVQR